MINILYINIKNEKSIRERQKNKEVQEVHSARSIRERQKKL
jgi:hypothetical protein